MSEQIMQYKIMEISVSDIIFPKEELRTKIFFEDLDELARSIRTVGLLNPLTVRASGDKYELIAGFRRLKASEIANLAVVPCRVVDSDDARADLQKLHENMFREEINPVDEGNFFKRLLIKNNWRIVDLSVQIHKSPSYVSKRIQLTDADPLIVSALSDNQINLSIADELSKIDDPDTRSRLLHYAIHSGATVDTVRSWRVEYEVNQQIPVRGISNHLHEVTGDTHAHEISNQHHPSGIAPTDPNLIPHQGVPITKFGEEIPPNIKIEERVAESRPCFSCMNDIDTQDLYVIYLCPTCRSAIEKAIHPDKTDINPKKDIPKNPQEVIQ